MAKHVFILGAGASREAGGPLMADFLDRAEDLMQQENVPITREAFTKTFDALAELRIVHSKAQLDTQNVESVFGAFEMARLFGTLGRLNQDHVAELSEQIATLIVQTVEHCVLFPISVLGLRAPDGYASLAKLCNEMKDVAILTFNYDIGLDVALLQEGLDPKYRVGPDRGQGVDLLKLHGSTNWYRPDGASQEVHVSHVEDFLPRVDLHNLRVNKHTATQLRISALGNRTFIVPPTWSKLDAYRRIEAVWRCAALHLKFAEHIYVMGYSLPPSDSFFPLLYALGTAGTARLRRFWVFDPSAAVEDRFRRLLGQETINRFQFRAWEFSRAVSTLRSCWQNERGLPK